MKKRYPLEKQGWSLRENYQENLVLKPNYYMGDMIPMFIFSALSFWFFFYIDEFIWVLVFGLFLAIGIILGIIRIITFSLHLNTEGFTEYYWFSSRTYRWKDIQSFDATRHRESIGCFLQLIGLLLSFGTLGGELLEESVYFYRNDLAKKEVFKETYGMNKDDFLDLMNSWKNRFGE